MATAIVKKCIKVNKKLAFRTIERTYKNVKRKMNSDNLVLDATEVKFRNTNTLIGLNAVKSFSEINHLGILYIPFEYASQFNDWYGQKETYDVITKSKHKYIRAKVLNVNTIYRQITYCYLDEIGNKVPIMEHSYDGFRIKGRILHLHIRMIKKKL